MSAEDPTPHLERFATYEEARREFRPAIPRHFNIAEAICRRHRDAVTRVVLIEVRPAANNTYTAGALDYFSDKFATVLARSGIVRGDAIAVMLSQSAALAVAHLGALKLGAVVVPLSPGTSPEQNDLILKHISATALIVEEGSRGDVALEVADRSSMKGIFIVADAIHGHIVKGGDRSFWREVYEASSNFQLADTAATTPAFIFCENDGMGAFRFVTHSHASLVG
jgi:acetyl-CoA synthetase